MERWWASAVSLTLIFFSDNLYHSQPFQSHPAAHLDGHVFQQQPLFAPRLVIVSLMMGSLLNNLIIDGPLCLQRLFGFSPLSDLTFCDEVSVVQIPFVMGLGEACTLLPAARAGITDFPQSISVCQRTPGRVDGKGGLLPPSTCFIFNLISLGSTCSIL